MCAKRISLKKQNELRKQKERERMQSPEFLEKLNAGREKYNKSRRIRSEFVKAHDKAAVAEIKMVAKRKELTPWEVGLLEAQKYYRANINMNVSAMF